MTFPPRLSRGIFSVICSTGSKPTRGKVTSHDRGDKAELLHDATNRPSRLPYTKRGAPSSSVSQTVLTDSSSSVAGRQAGTGVSRKRVVRRLKKNAEPNTNTGRNNRTQEARARHKDKDIFLASDRTKKEIEALENFKKLNIPKHSNWPVVQFDLDRAQANPHESRIDFDLTQMMHDNSCNINGKINGKPRDRVKKGFEIMSDGGTTTWAAQGETPAQRIKRLFREKRKRGLARVRERFAGNNSLNESSAESSPHESLDINTHVVFADNHLHPERAESFAEGSLIEVDKSAGNDSHDHDCNSRSRGKIHETNSIDPFKLIPGELVIHRKFGIGRFLGVRSIAMDDCSGKECHSTKECHSASTRVGYLFIEYADATAKIRPEKARFQLYRFASPGTIKSGVKIPKLSRIKDRKRWEQRENIARKHIRHLVMGQMSIYLQRLQSVRKPYCPPSEDIYQRFNELFPHDLTPDQALAVQDCYEDLTERDTPMDRIIVGDVGFGKTEVAMRAVFRVFSGGGQIFVLAPTTVLAKQHAATMTARLRPFGASIDLMTRNVKEAEKKDIIERWLAGRIHVLVGTHSLLNLPSTMYDPLNLLVIDEEQRFGVKHKDKISSLKSSIDVLTLSATPIPRTLHMAMAGFRDASLVTTPPPERRPIITRLQVYEQSVVHQAIQYELGRGGQIFYVVPRIQMMNAAKKRLKEIFQDIIILEVHGQMKGEYLDHAMDEFASGRAHILLCTTIVESGLDIPNVNTIIVEEVQQFGLASLYQLRGRVGRAGRQAYAYMFHAERGGMHNDAQERLLALEECCGLGEGFRLAERDMAIRGVGTLFGEKQSGEMDSIGADLYLEFLYEQLEKIEMLSLNPITPSEVHVPVFPTVPKLTREYVVSDEARKVADDSILNAKTTEELDKVVAHIYACFGQADAKSVNAMNFHRMRALAGELGVTRIEFCEDSGFINFTLDADLEVREMLLDNLDSIYKQDLKVTDSGIRVMALANTSSQVTVAQAVNALKRIHEALPPFIKFL